MKKWQCVALSGILATGVFALGSGALWLLLTHPRTFVVTFLAFIFFALFVRLWNFFYEEMVS